MTAAVVSPTLALIAAQLTQGLTLVKVAAAVIMVLGLALVAERVSPRTAGVLAGFPLGGAISLFFIGYEIGPGFAAQSAIYTTAGLISTLFFAFVYHEAARRSDRLGRAPALVLSSTAAIAAYALVAVLVKRLPDSLPLASAVALASIFCFDRLLRRVVDVRIAERKRVGPALLVLRAFWAAAVIVLITAAAGIVGPRWAGLFAAFPVTMFPLFLIIHYSYEFRHVASIIRNVPRGLVSLVIYCAAVTLCYPRLGVAWGTILAYALATLYLVAVNLRTRPGYRFRSVSGHPE